MKAPREKRLRATKPPWRWQKCGMHDQWHLWGAHGLRSLVLDNDHGDFQVRDSRGVMVPFDPEHPDARLIEASPDLLEALQYLGCMPGGYCFCVSGRDPQKEEHTIECAAARAAISKAEVT